MWRRIQEWQRGRRARRLARAKILYPHLREFMKYRKEWVITPDDTGRTAKSD